MTHEHPHPQVSIRIGHAADATAMGAVHAAAWRAAYADALPEQLLGTMDDDSFEAGWRSLFDEPPTPRHRVLVACEGDKVVGLSVVGPSDDGDGDESTALVDLLAVHPAARRHGHGSRLLNATADLARTSGWGTLTHWVYSEDVQTRDFLVAAGFALDGATRELAPDGHGSVLREVRLVTSLSAPTEGED